MADILFGLLTHPDIEGLERAVVIPYRVVGAGDEDLLVPVKSMRDLAAPAGLGKRYSCALPLAYHDGRFKPVVGVRYEKSVPGAEPGVDVLVETILHLERGKPVEVDLPFIAGRPTEHKYLDGIGYIGEKPINLGCGTEILCTKAGNTPSCDGQLLALQVPKPLPSSD